MMPEAEPIEEPIVVTVTVLRHGHSTRVTRAAITSGPPHVRAWNSSPTGDLGETCTQLASNGYAFHVRTHYEDISLLEWMARMDPPPHAP